MGLYSGLPKVNSFLGLSNKVHTFFVNLRDSFVVSGTPKVWKTQQTSYPTTFMSRIKLVRKLK